MLVGGNHEGKATDTFNTSKQQLVQRDIKEKEEDNVERSAQNKFAQAGADPTSGFTQEGAGDDGGDGGPPGGI